MTLVARIVGMGGAGVRVAILEETDDGHACVAEYDLPLAVATLTPQQIVDAVEADARARVAARRNARARAALIGTRVRIT